MTLRCLLFAVLLFLPAMDSHAGLLDEPSTNPVNVEADDLWHDDRTQTITATGNVVIVQGERTLKADKVVYDMRNDTVIATGNVSLTEGNGDVHFADYAELREAMKKGYVDQLHSVLADGSHFKARQGRRIAGKVTKMKGASYTPCKLCADDPDKDPLWQIRASEVTYDEENEEVSYKNARFELFGIPLFFTPVFSHPDPRIERKSGFLRPTASWTSKLGGNVELGYYWDIAQGKDATLKLKPTTEQGVLAEGEWRQRFTNGRIQIRGSGATGSTRTERNGVEETDLTRGHITAEGLFDINNKWRAGFRAARSSDKEYLRLYEISDENVLENEAYVERFSGRNYSRVSAMSYQDLRLGIAPLDQPDILPVAEHHMVGEPRGILGGNWFFNAEALGLHRGEDEQGVLRASGSFGWHRQFIAPIGFRLDVDADVHGDVYEVRDRFAAAPPSPLPPDSSAARVLPRFHTVARYPFVRNFRHTQAIIEPIASFTAATNIENNDPDVPNEDSIGPRLTMLNLFEANRFPGTDRLEDELHAAYGVRASLQGHNGRSGEVSFGQSYRLQDDETPSTFPRGSGLEHKSSDFVGRVKIALDENVQVDYGVRLDHETLDAESHEIAASGGNDRFNVWANYFYQTPIAGTGFTETREQAGVGGSYQLSSNWRTTVSALTDMGEEPGLRKASMELQYTDECFTFTVHGARNLTNDATGENETTFFVRLGFKNLGEISTPSLLFEDQEQE